MYTILTIMYFHPRHFSVRLRTGESHYTQSISTSNQIIWSSLRAFSYSANQYSVNSASLPGLVGVLPKIFQVRASSMKPGPYDPRASEKQVLAFVSTLS